MSNDIVIVLGAIILSMNVKERINAFYVKIEQEGDRLVQQRIASSDELRSIKIHFADVAVFSLICAWDGSSFGSLRIIKGKAGYGSYMTVKRRQFRFTARTFSGALRQATEVASSLLWTVSDE